MEGEERLRAKAWIERKEEEKEEQREMAKVVSV